MSKLVYECTEKTYLFISPCNSRANQHTFDLKWSLKENQSSTQSKHVCTFRVLRCDLASYIQVHWTSVIPWPHLFHHQTTYLTYIVIEIAMRTPSGMAELQLHTVANLLRCHVCWCIWLDWEQVILAMQWMAFSVNTSAGAFSFPSKTLEGLFYNSRQAEYATAVA